ncbi:MAG: mechanosensitive ion channel domain-containing protein [Planctomycetota bacterium]
MDLLSKLVDWVPFLAAVALTIAALWGADMLLLRRSGLRAEKRLPRQMMMLALTLVAAVVIVVLIPTTESGLITDQTKGNLLSLLGLGITAVLTLSSTTLAGNGLAALMLRSTGSFHPGDFIRVNEHFGRVTERGLFHTEIQCEDRDLLSLPNMYLVTNPVRVVRSSGTIITAEVSLGYDTPHSELSPLLENAAERAGLAEPFVWIIELQDHAVVYRVCGFLEEIKTLISARSKLRASILDVLHDAGVEIVSPGFVYQRRTDTEQKVIAPSGDLWRQRRGGVIEDEETPEDLVFDKAEEAGKQAETDFRVSEIREELEELRKRRKQRDEGEAEEIDRQVAALEAELELLSAESDPDAETTSA